MESQWEFVFYFCTKVERFMLIAFRQTASREFGSRICKSFKDIPKGTARGINLEWKGTSFSDTRRNRKVGGRGMFLEVRISGGPAPNFLSGVRKYTKRERR